MRIRTQRWLAALGGAALLSGLLAGCAHDQEAIDNIATACATEVAINGSDFPGLDPEGPNPTQEELFKFANNVGPLADKLAKAVPDDLKDDVAKLQEAVAGARKGQPIVYEGPLSDAGAEVDKWMYEHCDYRQLEITNDGKTLVDLPETLDAGPVVIKFVNADPKTSLGFVLLFGKVREGQSLTAADVIAGADINDKADIVAVATGDPTKAAYGVAELPAGKYVVATPISKGEGDFSGVVASDLTVE